MLMGLFIAKTVVAAAIISFASWLAGKRPELAGFIIALPLTTMLALAFAFAQTKDTEASITFAKSILVGVPISLLFFVPFLLAEKFQLSFWVCYAAGIILLAIGYLIHRSIMGA